MRKIPENTLAPIVFNAVLMRYCLVPTVLSYFKRVWTLNSTANPMAVTRLTTDTALIMILSHQVYAEAREDEVGDPDDGDHAEDQEDDDDG